MIRVIVNSFSYKQGLDCSASSHGGGFVFDCRCLPNPGRQDCFKAQTGLDSEVQHFLKASDAVASYVKAVGVIINQAIADYLERGFSELMISFGCTGGQHRSVYLAEIAINSLIKKKGVQANLFHQVLKIKKSYPCVP
jgi:RNase adaptor protein for sRNA GlmZ degradation